MPHHYKGHHMHAASTLIDCNLREHTHGGLVSWHMVAAAHEATIRDLHAQLCVFVGDGFKPRPGCVHYTMPLHGAEVLVEFEPGDDGEMIPQDALVNGKWVDADELARGKLYDEWCDLAKEAA